jgi:hypothetical protein
MGIQGPRWCISLERSSATTYFLVNPLQKARQRIEFPSSDMGIEGASSDVGDKTKVSHNDNMVYP